MKLLILSAIILINCNLYSSTFISGIIKEVKETKLTLKYYATNLDYIEGNSTTLETEVDNNGKFEFEINTNTSFTFNMLLGNEWMIINKYAEPNDSIRIEYSKDKISISGRGEYPIEFIYEFEDSFFTKKQVKEFNENSKLLNPYDYSEYWKKRHRSQLDFLKNYPKKSFLSSSFLNFYKAEIDYTYGLNMLQYCFKHSPDYKTLDTIVNDSSYMSFLKELNINSESSLNNPSYINFIRELPNILWTSLVDNKNLSKEKKEFYLKNQSFLRDSFAKLYFKNEIYDIALYTILVDEVESLNRNKGKEIYENDFISTTSLIKSLGNNFSNKIYRELLINQLNWLKSKDVPAPDFAAIDMNNNLVKLSNFKGKVVYINFWSTSCGPCIAEIPHLAKLKKNFSNENVVFLCVSLDNSIDKVKKTIDSKSFSGTHLISKEGFASSVAKLYKITSIPRFVIIDQNGFIVNSDAPSPRNNPDEIIKRAIYSVKKISK